MLIKLLHMSARVQWKRMCCESFFHFSMSVRQSRVREVEIIWPMKSMRRQTRISEENQHFELSYASRGRFREKKMDFDEYFNYLKNLFENANWVSSWDTLERIICFKRVKIIGAFFYQQSSKWMFNFYSIQSHL